MPEKPAKTEIDRLLEEDKTEIDKQIEENLKGESIDDSQENAEKSDGNPPDDASQEGAEKSDGNPPEETQENKPEANKPRRAPDGVSRAYDDIGLDDLNKQAASKKKEEKTSGWNITPPNSKREKTKISDKDNIMELIWKEFILASYAGAIDFVVDTTLDFVEWVLYAPFKKGNRITIETEPDGPKTIYAMGDEVFKKRREGLEQGKNKFDKSYMELKENLARGANGERPRWNTWGGEPSFYQELKAIAKKAKDNPESEEATIMKNFDNVPEMTESLLKKELGLFKIALNLATIETVVEPVKGILSAEATQKLDDLEKQAKNKDQPIDHKQMEEILKEVKKTITGEDEASKTVYEELNKIAQAKNNKQILDSLKKINKVNSAAGSDEDVIKAHILQLSKEKYNQITQNIDKIHEKYKDNPKDKAVVVKGYVTHLIKSITEAKPAVDKLINSKIPGSRSKAQGAVAKANQSIDNFQLAGEDIGKVKAASIHIENPFETKDKDVFLRNVRNYTMGMDR